MRISRDGVIPQIEPDGAWSQMQVRLGGLKRLLQSTNFPMQAVVVGNTSITVWATSAWLRSLFLNDPRLYALAVLAALVGWLSVYYVLVLPGEQAWGQNQSQRTERSPLKCDTEEALVRLDRIEQQLTHRDNHEADTQQND